MGALEGLLQYFSKGRFQDSMPLIGRLKLFIELIK